MKIQQKLFQKNQPIVIIQKTMIKIQNIKDQTSQEEEEEVEEKKP